MRLDELSALLRRKREKEQRAAEALRRRIAAHRDAVALHQRAQQAVADHQARRRVEERALYRDMAGRAMSLQGLDRLQGTLADLAAAANALGDAATASEVEMRHWATSVAQARSVHRQHFYASEMWQDFTERVAAEAAKRAEILGELETAELAEERVRPGRGATR